MGCRQGPTRDRFACGLAACSFLVLVLPMGPRSDQSKPDASCQHLGRRGLWAVGPAVRQVSGATLAGCVALSCHVPLPWLSSGSLMSHFSEALARRFCQEVAALLILLVKYFLVKW